MPMKMKTPALGHERRGQNRIALQGDPNRENLLPITCDCKAKAYALQASRLWRLCREAAQTGARRGLPDDVLIEGVTRYATAIGQRRDLDVLTAAEIAAAATRAAIRGAVA